MKERERTSPPSDAELPRIKTGGYSTPTSARGRRLALGVLLLASFVMVSRLVASIWEGLLVGVMFGFVAQPAYRRLSTRLGDRKALAAWITTISVGLASTVAFVMVIWVVSRELIVLAQRVQHLLSARDLAEVIGEPTTRLVERLGISRVEAMHRLQEQLTRAAGPLAEGAAVVVQTTGSAALSLILGLLTMYYTLVEWPNIPLRLERILPLDPRHTRALVLEFRDVGRSALIGTIATAAVQGALAGVGFALAGVPQAITWGIITALASFVPVVGTMLVWGPIAAWLLVKGHVGSAVFLASFGFIVVVGFSDYVARPRFVGAGREGHPLLVLVALLGGIEVFGLAGVLVGPVLMSLFLAILRIYERESELEARAMGQTPSPPPSSITPTPPMVREKTPS
jgi:predicted PurR-regulated permease PerM